MSTITATPKPTILTDHFTKFDYKNKQHRYILSLCYQFGWETTKNGKPLADMERLAAWLQSVKAPVQKPLTEMSRQQLSRTITALENMVNKKY